MSNQEATSSLREPPQGFFSCFRFLGPGLIISAAIVGSGELIATTALGAKAGFAVLWVVLFGCVIKVAVQLEYGRHCICHGKTAGRAWNSDRGLRVLGAHWSVFTVLLFMLSMFIGQAGVLGGAAQVIVYAFPGMGIEVGVGVLCIALGLLVFHGRYEPIEHIATLLNLLFLFIIFYCVFAVQGTRYGFGFNDIAGGFSLKLPPGTLVLAVTAFGITGIAAGEIFIYPYWCLEKGYAVWTGPRDASPEWAARARGWIRVMTFDALASLVLYTAATVAFYLLGAAVLRPQEELSDGNALILQLSRIFTEVLGDGAMALFMVGAFAVLFSTAFANNAGHGRVWIDLLALYRLYDTGNPRNHARALAALSWVMPAIWGLVYLTVQKVVLLVVIMGVANSIFLLVVAYQALIFRYRDTDPRVAPKPWYDVALWLSVVAIGFMAWRSILSAFA